MSNGDKINVFTFMALRAPEAAGRPRSTREYIWDTGGLERQSLEYLDDGQVVADYRVSRRRREPFRPDSDSAVGRLVYTTVFDGPGGRSPKQVNEAVVAGVLDQMVVVQPQLGTAAVPGRTVDVVRQLEEQAHIATASGDRFYLLPTRLVDSPAWDSRTWLPQAREILWRHARATIFDKAALVAELGRLFGHVQGVWSQVFLEEGHAYNGSFLDARTALWDTLYQLYILRRIADVDLGEVMDGIRVLHALELVAVDACLAAARAGGLPPFPGAGYYATIFEGIYPEHRGLAADPLAADAYAFVASASDLLACLQAEVVVPPIVAELGYYAVGKFNAITPYLGDLKVVKQWLRGYRVGEIARITNIMKGEEKKRSLQVTERSVDTLSYSSDSSQSVSNERQSSDKYDIKQEAEKVLKSQLEAKANVDTQISYDGGSYKIQTGIGAGFAYSNSSEASRTSANAFAREVMDKAVTQVERRTAQARSITSTHETVEVDAQKYVNTDPGAVHVSGIYRWLDKRYEARLYNYGKRWMFEFVIPEPAAFLVESRLQAAAKDMRLPRPPEREGPLPTLPRHPVLDRDLTPSDIDRTVFDRLAIEYDLSGFAFPSGSVGVDLLRRDTGAGEFEAAGLADNQWTSKSYGVTLSGASGLSLTSLSVTGRLEFSDRQRQPGESVLDPTLEPNTTAANDNTIVISLAGREIYRESNNNLGGWTWQPKIIAINPPLPLSADDTNLVIGLQDGRSYRLNFTGTLVDTSIERFQVAVYNAVKAQVEERVGPDNEKRRLAYESALSAYRKALDELDALTVNELIQGRSEAFNLAVIREELKRQCISIIAREFDWDESDDALRTLKPVRERKVDMSYPVFAAGDQDGSPYARFESPSFKLEFPFVHLDDARRKGRFVQFLEQAFEWGQVSYLTYPYFWGRRPKWLELMNRLDYADSAMTAFLRAGSARVLVAVTSGYYDAVMYFLATREPWSGGPAPVIGDPLFIPVHEEIRKQQDDLLGAVPDGEPWQFTVPTSLVYLQDSSSPIPGDLADTDVPA